MAIPVWPNISSAAKYDGYGLSLSDGSNLAVTDMESGEKRLRRRFNTTISPHSVTIELTNAEVETFKTFWRTALRQGAFWFYMPIYTGSTYVTSLVRIVPDNQPRIMPTGHNNNDLSLQLHVRDLR